MKDFSNSFTTCGATIRRGRTHHHHRKEQQHHHPHHHHRRSWRSRRWRSLLHHPSFRRRIWRLTKSIVDPRGPPRVWSFHRRRTRRSASCNFDISKDNNGASAVYVDFEALTLPVFVWAVVERILPRTVPNSRTLFGGASSGVLVWWVAESAGHLSRSRRRDTIISVLRSRERLRTSFETSFSPRDGGRGRGRSVFSKFRSLLHL